MTATAFVLIALPFALAGYAYVLYPLLLRLLATSRPEVKLATEPPVWPLLTITLPAYNEAGRIAETLDHLLELDYPADRRQLLVISDASTDRTDEIVRSYSGRGVELLRLASRGGKTAAENAAGVIARGDIIVNVDATVRIPRHALKTLVRAFGDPAVGVASGRDVSVGDTRSATSHGESGYVGYEMTVRRLETRLGGIVGSSGCFYGVRRSLHDSSFPPELSRDFASALIAKERGMRAVSVDDAVCYVPRAAALRVEFERKIRTMARGLETLWHMRQLMNPVRHGGFALKLISHKLCRWLVYVSIPGAVLGLALLSGSSLLAFLALALGCGALALGLIALRLPPGSLPRPLALPGFVVASNLAGMLAWLRVIRRQHAPTWEPTRRPQPQDGLVGEHREQLR